MPLEPGTQLGRYRLLSQLGAGGMGEVYRAYDTRLQREVALKIVPEHLASGAASARFEREARAAAALSHPNVLSVFDVGYEEGVAFVVTELLRGKTLRDELRRGPIPAPRAADIFTQILNGLEAAHQQGIIHRDIKPENIFVTQSGLVKILDFGLARAVEAADSSDTPTAITREGVVVGTLGYMSPEQLRGEPVDMRSDLFSAGCVFYEMLAGRHPFGRTTGTAMATAILESQPDISSSAGIPAQYATIISRCLAKNRASRPASAAEVRWAISGEGPAATGAPARRQPRIWLLAGAIAAVVLLAMALVLPRMRGPAAVSDERVISLAVLPLSPVSPDAPDDFFTDGLTETLITELAQIGSLRVISRNSVMRYRRTSKAAPEIARELGADVIVTGSVIRANDRVRVNAHLVDGRTDAHLWARTYERDIRDVLTLQGELAHAIAREIGARVTPQEQARLTRERVVDPAALELYLRGRAEWNRRTEESLRAATELFERAIAADPGYAAAHAGLADAYSIRANNGYLPAVEGYPKAKAAAREALRLDPHSAEGHTALGFVLFAYEHDWSAAMEELRTALDLMPNYATAHQWYGTCLFVTGQRHAAIDHQRRAVGLDPLAPRVRSAYAETLFFIGRRSEAKQLLAANLEEDAPMAALLLSDIAVQEAEWDRALAFAQRCCASPGRRQLQSAYVTASAGQADKASQMIDAVPTYDKQPAHIEILAKALVAAGRIEEAAAVIIEYPQDAWVPAVVGDPAMEPLRRHQRWPDVRRVLGL